jgi:transcription elongation factor/antiterminator RfaH
VIQTKPQAEGDVKLRLENAHFEVFYPRIKAAVKGANRQVSRVKSLFPSYLFARMNLDDANVLHMIKYTRGVHKILGSGPIPVPIPKVVVETIRERVSDADVIEQQMVFKKGDQVRVRGGWLDDLVGILEKPVSPAGRVKVLLNIVNKCVRAELDIANIERLD